MMKRLIWTIASFAIGALLVWLLFRGTDWDRVYGAVRQAHLGWLLLMEIPIILSFITRIQRWSYIVRAAKPVSFRHMFSATQIGFLANFTLPARIGEAVRPLVLARLAKIPFSQCLALNALDRVADLVSLIPIIVIAAVALPATGKVQIPAETFRTAAPISFETSLFRTGAAGTALFLAAVLTVLVLLYVNQAFVFRASDRCVGLVSTGLARRIRQILEHFAAGLHVFRSAADMAKSVAFSFITWAMFLVAALFLFFAFDIESPWYGPFVMQALLAVFVSVPGAPGLIGQFHIPIVLAVLILSPETSPDEAKAAAIMLHLLNFIPLAAMGVYCLVREKMGLIELTRESARAQDRVPPPPASPEGSR